MLPVMRRVEEVPRLSQDRRASSVHDPPPTTWYQYHGTSCNWSRGREQVYAESRRRENHLPMDVDSTTFLLGMINAMVKGLMLTGPIVQTLMDEVIAFGEPLKEVLIIDIVHWDVKMMIAACGWRIVLELPVDSGDDVRDIAVFQSLCTFETDEPDAVS